jgi:magnesium transporter
MSDRPSRSLPLRERATRWVDRRGHPESPERSMDPRPERMVADAGAALVDSAIYVDGCRLHSPKTLADTYRMFRDEPRSMAWIGLYRPSEEQLLSLARQFALHELAVEDAIVAHQRP